MPGKPAPFKFKIGDRVAERPRYYGSCATTKEGIAKYNQFKNQRYGIVLDLEVKKDSRGAKRKFIKVRWDHNNTIGTHEQMRLCAVEDLEKITVEMRELIGA